MKMQVQSLAQDICKLVIAKILNVIIRQCHCRLTLILHFSPSLYYWSVIGSGSVWLFWYFYFLKRYKKCDFLQAHPV